MRYLKNLLLITAMLLGINAWAEDSGSKVTIVKKLAGVETTADVGDVSYTVGTSSVEVTVTPKNGYYFTNEDLTVERTTAAENAQSRRRAASNGPGYAGNPSVNPGQGNSLTGTSTFTFDLDDDENITYLVTANFHRRISLTGATVALNKTSFVYDGSEAKPTVTSVTLNGVTLTANDFSVDYANNVNVPASGSTLKPTVIVTGLGKYKDEATQDFTITKRPVTFTGETDTKTYTGSEMELTGLTVSSGENVGLVSGHTHNVTYSAKGTTASTYAGTITAKDDVVIKSGDTPVTSNYDITIVNGALTIGQDNTAIVIGSSTKSWTYDGVTHKDEVYTVTYGGQSVNADASGKVFTLDTGDKVTITPTAAGVQDYNEAYSENNIYTYVLDNASCYASVTANVGTLSISKASVTVTAKSESFTYDGTAHSNAGYDVSGLVGNDQISAVVEGTITFPSESPVTNRLKSYEFTTGKAGNYSVTTADGELTMTNASVAITITAATQEWTHDGSTHSNSTVTVTSGSLFTGDELVAEATGSVTDVADTSTGNNPVKAGYKVMHGDQDVTSNYVITPVAGTLTVAKADIPAEAITAPVVIEGLIFDGELQTLIEAGSVADAIGTMLYSLDQNTWSEELPQASAVGSHTVYYKVVGDANHNDVAVQTVTAVIADMPMEDALQKLYDAIYHAATVLSDGQYTHPKDACDALAAVIYDAAELYVAAEKEDSEVTPTQIVAMIKRLQEAEEIFLNSGVTTGIWNVNGNVDGNCYDLQGRRVVDGRLLKGNVLLKKGKHIVNGKIVIVK